jgi:hypothetical protein
MNATKPSRSVLRTLLLWASGSAAAVVLLVGLALLNNNYSLRRLSAGEFRARLDRSIETSTAWISSHPDMFGNQALMFMIVDMEKMSGDPRLRRLVAEYRQSKFVTDTNELFSRVWARMVDPQAPVPTIDLTAVPASDVMETLWDAYAIAPDRVKISPAQRANMFSPSKYYWGRRHHQLLALDIYRYYNGGSAELDATLSHLAEKVARDAHFDLRVNDSYPQRTAFILGAGRPDLIRPRWIERLLNYQRSDGAWSYYWHGWGKGVLEFGQDENFGSSHATVQAAWALYMLKYRFPRWIDQHYT